MGAEFYIYDYDSSEQLSDEICGCSGKAGFNLMEDFMQKERKYKYCICGRIFNGYGNNPHPYFIEEKGECCDYCNMKFVIPARLKLSKRQGDKKGR